MATHYETLDVASSASYDKIRQAYHSVARQWHPDKFIDADLQVGKAAEEAMRQANEAWHVLGDEERRRNYDRSLRGGASGIGQNLDGDPTITVQDGVTRVDPRLLDPSVLDAHRRRQLDNTEQVNFRVRRAVPFIGFIGLMVGIFVFTAYARGDSGEAPSEQTVPGPGIGVSAGACIRIIEGGQPLEVPCASGTANKLIAVLDVGNTQGCPLDTVSEASLYRGLIACLSWP